MKLNRTGLLVIMLALLGIVALSGCNTVEGVGKDIEKTGEAISDAADGD